MIDRFALESDARCARTTAEQRAADLDLALAPDLGRQDEARRRTAPAPAWRRTWFGSSVGLRRLDTGGTP